MKKCIFILILSFIYMPIKVKAQEKILFEDDFIDNRNGWTEDNTDNVMRKIQDGKYIFHHKRKANGWFVWQTVEIDENNDFTIEATIKKVSGRNSNEYAIAWGLEDVYNYYEFAIEGNGYYCYIKEIHNNSIFIIPWTESEYINKGNATNTLSVKKVTNKIKFFINGHYVNEADFEEFFGDLVGIYLFKNLKIEIEHIMVKQKTSSE